MIDVNIMMYSLKITIDGRIRKIQLWKIKYFVRLFLSIMI